MIAEPQSTITRLKDSVEKLVKISLLYYNTIVLTYYQISSCRGRCVRSGIVSGRYVVRMATTTMTPRRRPLTAAMTTRGKAGARRRRRAREKVKKKHEKSNLFSMFRGCK